MESIGIDQRGNIAVMQMKRGKASALDLEFTQAIIDTLATLAQGPAWAAVLTGSGNIFSAGVDLLRLQSEGAAYIERFVPLVSKLVHALFEFPKPLIAAINGHAVAGGCVIACATDYRIMARGNGRIGVPELQVGLPFPNAAVEVVRFVVPAQHIKTVVYDAATYGADDALRLGLVDEVCDAAALLDRAVNKAQSWAAAPPAAFALTKRQLHAPILQNIADGEQRDLEVARLWQAPESIERVHRHVVRTFKPPAA